MEGKRIAFITGGNRGIGFETARQLGRLGILPVIGARTDAGAAAARQLRSEGIVARAILFDATDPGDHRRAHDLFESMAGRLDILVNNAAVYLDGETGVQDLYTAADVPQDVLRRTMEANLYAPIQLTQALLPLLRRAPAGRIVNLSSILASLTLHRAPDSPIHGSHSVAYNMSKTALNAYTVHLAKALEGSRVKVNAAHPGWVQTAMGGSAAPMPVEEGARTSVQLATLPDDGPNGGFFHLGEALPW